MSMCIVVLVFGCGSNLQVILDVQVVGQFDVDVVGVLFDCFGVVVLLKVVLEWCWVCVLADFVDCVVFDVVLVDVLVVFVLDWVVCVGYMCIFGLVFVQCFSGCLVNIYFLLLLCYKGLYIYVCVLEVGDVEYGVSVYFVVFELDVGMVLVQVWVLVLFGDSVELLVQWVLVVEYLLLIVSLCLFVVGCVFECDGQVVVDGYFLFNLLCLDCVGQLNC